MVVAYKTLSDADLGLTLARQERNDLQEQIHPVLRDYRKALPTFFPEGHAIVESLPRLSPLPGSTPDAITASGVWDATEMKARITWTASGNVNLQEYQVRFVPGPVYITDDESLLVLKTRKALVPEVVAALADLHPYDVPELLALPVEQGGAAYLDWVREATAPDAP